jgi:hypothetical protein
MRKLLLSAIVIAMYFTTYSQATMYIGSKEYQTVGWNFLNAGKYHTYEYNGSTDISIAKTKSGGGLLVISFKNSFGHVINGPIYIYLPNEKPITLNTRYSKDFSDETSTSTFPLTALQVNILKRVNISAIRYSLYSDIGNYKTNSITAENRINKSYEPNYYEAGMNFTTADIITLYNDF